MEVSWGLYRQEETRCVILNRWQGRSTLKDFFHHHEECEKFSLLTTKRRTSHLEGRFVRLFSEWSIEKDLQDTILISRIKEEEDRSRMLSASPEIPSNPSTIFRTIVKEEADLDNSDPVLPGFSERTYIKNRSPILSTVSTPRLSQTIPSEKSSGRTESASSD